MESILYQLFNGDYDITPEWDKKQQELSKTILASLNKIAAVFGPDFVDDLCAQEAEQEAQQEFHYFRAGFLLGARMMLEALEV